MLKNITGQRFNRLVAIGHVATRRGKAIWRCRCDCGNFTEVIGNHLRSGETQSCGCLHIERTIKASRTHGMARTRAYTVWGGIIQRCLDRNCRGYKLYGGRGITVCKRWRKFENFFSDMGEPPTGMSIERKDNSGPYDSKNCQWANKSEQARNRRNNFFVTYNGETLCLAEWAERTGLKQHTLRYRIVHGWPVTKALQSVKYNGHGKILI